MQQANEWYHELSRKQHVASKEYECRDCKDTISKGEKHWKIAALEDGEFITRRTHAPNGECAFYKWE